ncbi:transposase [Nostoc sp. ChiQUE01b]|uniref:transposase n=1 Tax=Nostoc sp. ChiQUE01b TaxID=3075376 RepID=UPI002AD3CA77|nr:transposase [Nostoc sp. ChiQUE01b]MDZ8258864.1 transposase [Nostoc sp. ChiQUE01b]MDZ8261064.1 transposase [Nostoc sp. ChiQUE01b]
MKNTCTASIESKGFCHYKCTNGIKRHLAVDTLGLPFFTHCSKASVTDDQGLIELLSHNLDYFRAKPVNIPKITILLDHGYHPNTISTALEKLYPQVLTKIEVNLHLSRRKPKKQPKAKQDLSQLQHDGSLNVPMLGWSGVRA